jgi:hypothetical protein
MPKLVFARPPQDGEEDSNAVQMQPDFASFLGGGWWSAPARGWAAPVA